MSAATIAKLGMIFLGLGLCATFLMYWLWGFPFDKETRTSSAPKPLMYTHRVLGYLFVICYIAIMWHMVPRLWTYQVEFPTRTVAHILLGVTVGFLLLIKISIMRFFRHFEEWMPYLGTAILLCSFLLLGLSVPFIFQEKALAASAPGGNVYSEESRARVQRLLPHAGLPAEAPGPEVLASESSLRKGRDVLLGNCVKCHDLRTILVKPRTPSSWYRTVLRMAEKPALFSPISEKSQWHVTAYLVAITPDLQKSAKKLREEKQLKKQLMKASAEVGMDEMMEPGDAEPGDTKPAAPSFDPKKAKETFEEVCSECHELEDIDAEPPKTAEDIDPIIERMIENDLEIEPDNLEIVKWYLLKHYVEKSL